MWDLSPIVVNLLVGALLFVPLERLLPTRRNGAPPQTGRLVDFIHATLGAQIIKIGSALLLAVFLIDHPGVTLVSGLPLWLQVIILLVISDFIIWALHYASHAVPFLWRFHKIHHSSVRLDWLATARVHPCEQIMVGVATGLPMFLLGFSPTAMAIYVGLHEVHSALLHANTRLSFGPLEAVFTPPRVHHWHHAIEQEAYDSNFGSQLVIWDRMFGTAYRPDREQPAAFGVDDAPEENFVTHLLAPFQSQHGKTPAATFEA